MVQVGLIDLLEVSHAEVLSKALGSRTVMSGSVSKGGGKDSASRSLQMMERPLMTPDELKSRRRIRVLVTRHTGSGRFCPCRIKHRVQISTEICLVLLCVKQQKTNKVECLWQEITRTKDGSRAIGMG